MTSLSWKRKLKNVRKLWKKLRKMSKMNKLWRSMFSYKYQTFIIILHHCSWDDHVKYDASLDSLDFLLRFCCWKSRTQSSCVNKLLHSNYSSISLSCNILFISHSLHSLLLCLVQCSFLTLSFQLDSSIQSNQVWATTFHKMQLQYCAEIEFLNIMICKEILYSKTMYHCNI